MRFREAKKHSWSAARWLLDGKTLGVTAGALDAHGLGAAGTSVDAWYPLDADATPISFAIFTAVLWDHGAGPVLIVGGDFPGRIASWDGTSWSLLGPTMNSVVNALAVDGSGNLIAGDRFTSAGGMSVNRIARWNGSNWNALGSGMNDDVFALTVDGSGKIYAGGDFTTAGGVNANRIARWDGSTWGSLGSGMNNTVNDLAVDSSGNLIAGGRFSTAGDTPAHWIAGYGTVESTATVVVGAMPLETGMPTQFTAEVTGITAPSGGKASFVGMPAGQCSDLTLKPLDATTSVASCSVV